MADTLRSAAEAALKLLVDQHWAGDTVENLRAALALPAEAGAVEPALNIVALQKVAKLAAAAYIMDADRLHVLGNALAEAGIISGGIAHPAAACEAGAIEP